MLFQNPLSHVFGGTWRSAVNGPTTQHPLGDVCFLTPAPLIRTQVGESSHITVKVVPILSSFVFLFLLPPCILFFSHSSESLAHTVGLGRTWWGLFPLRQKKGGRQRGQKAKQDAWLQSPAWDVTLDTLLQFPSCALFKVPATVVPESFTEYGPTLMVDVLPASLTPLGCLARWSSGPSGFCTVVSQNPEC